MKTLLVTHRNTGTSWLETDEGFATLYASNPDAVRDMRALETGRRLFFSMPGERETSPRVPFLVRRLETTVSRIGPRDIIAPLLALAIWIAGLFMAPAFPTSADWLELRASIDRELTDEIEIQWRGEYARAAAVYLERVELHQ